MVSLELEPRAAEWKAQTNPLSYGGTPHFSVYKLLKIPENEYDNLLVDVSY